MDRWKTPGQLAKELAAATALQNLYKEIEKLAEDAISTPCFGNDLFVMDFIRGDDIGEICTPCPVFALCEIYAAIARPEAGVWAGRRWNKSPELAVITDTESEINV